jgi:hypothetical protein
MKALREVMKKPMKPPNISVVLKDLKTTRISNFRVRYPPQTGSTHDAYAVGYSCYPPSNMTQQSSPNAPFFVAGDGNGRPIQKSDDFGNSDNCIQSRRLLIGYSTTMHGMCLPGLQG